MGCCGPESWWWTRQGYYFWCTCFALQIACVIANLVLAFTSAGNLGGNLGAAGGTAGGMFGTWPAMKLARSRSRDTPLPESLVETGRGAGEVGA